MHHVVLVCGLLVVFCLFWVDLWVLLMGSYVCIFNVCWYGYLWFGFFCGWVGLHEFVASDCCVGLIVCCF